MTWISVIVEADGGSRGNPGPAAYGAVLRDAETGEVIAERGEQIGVATNNVAEYRGLIAGLELAAEHAPEASIECRLDSKLVVEQMSGNWKIKHPDMRPLAVQANHLAPFGTVFTWVPRALNAHADRLANEALDGVRDANGLIEQPQTKPTVSVPESSARPTEPITPPWSSGGGPPTTLILVRHGVTEHTSAKLFSSGIGGQNPGLTEEGRDQIRATAQWLEPVADGIDAVVSSPVRRTHESAEILAEMLGMQIETEPGVAEMEFGVWDGLSFTEVAQQYPDELDAWLGSLDHAPGGGESLREVQTRVLAGRDRIVSDYRGQAVLVVSHVTPIKVVVADALGAPLESLFRMEMSPGSVTVISYFYGGKDGRTPMSSLRMYNARPTEVAFLHRAIH